MLRLQRRGGQAALSRLHQAYSLRQGNVVQVGVVQQPGQKLFEGSQLVCHQTRGEFRQQLLQGGECHQLLRVHPEPREFAAALAGHEAVATQRAVEFHLHIEAFAQLGEVALECGNGNAQRVHQFLRWHGVAAGEQAAIAVEAVDFTHVDMMPCFRIVF